ncbi:cytochrome P450 [Nostoc sp. ChiQUE01b]|uniref:cytochrome P450 n=1 Tax=Nostoc sp. ChiQUE01b TaxID=3075376 RepID=UPI002AD1F82D|nr:cytochrome P450 [Nostoc sp. ChiQUE01b]MDZ8262751.1 cytochrome P450 [Nostoc sp. ChiQUE01b]
MILLQGPKTPGPIQMLQWIFDPLGYTEAASQRYGDIFLGKVGWDYSPHVFVSNPKAIEQIFTSESKQFYPLTESFKKFSKPILGEHSISVLEGVNHRRQRQLLMPYFHGEQIKKYGIKICYITEKIMSRLDHDKPFLVHELMKNISLEAILEVVFGLGKGERYQLLKKLLLSWLNYLVSPVHASLLFFSFLQKDLGSWSPWGRFIRLKKQLDEVLYSEIQERRKQVDSEHNDILTLLLSSRDEKGEGMTDEELHDTLLTLLIAGYETTSGSLAWALYWIHHMPNVYNKLLKELDSLGNSPDVLSLSQLPYLTAISQETLRIYPIAPLNLPHVVIKPAKLMDYELKPGTKVVIDIYQTHHREDLYPNPKQFRPERFLEKQFSSYEYLPFGGGSRRCIGAALSLFEMKLVLATILLRYQLKLLDKKPVQPRRQISFIVPAGGVKMAVLGQH